MVKNKGIRTVLCLSEEGIALCQIANQQGRGFLLSAKTVQITQQSKEDFLKKGLSDALQQLDPKELKKVRDVLLASSVADYLPLELYYSRPEHFQQSARYELQHQLGEEIQSLEFKLYRTDNETYGHTFFLKKEVCVQLEETLSAYEIKRPYFLPATALFIEGIKQQTTLAITDETFFIDLGRDNLTLIFREKNESKVSLFPVDLPSLDEDWEGYRQQLYETIKKEAYRLDENFLKARWIGAKWIDQQLGLSQSLQVHFSRIRDDFKQQISLAIGSEAVDFVEPFLPALLVIVTSEPSSFLSTIDFQKKTVASSQKKGNFSLLGRAIIVSVSLTLFLHGYAWRLQNRCIADEINIQNISREKERLEALSKRIESALQQLQAIQKRTDEVAISWNQNRTWCQFFNQLKQLFDTAGELYLTSMQWHIEALQKQENRKRPMKNSKKSTKNVKTTQVKMKPASVKPKKSNATADKRVKEIQASLKCSGLMYIGDLALQGKTKEEYNRRFNKLFQSIAQLPDCNEVSSIKMHPPQQGTITFDFTIKLNSQSKLLAR